MEGSCKDNLRENRRTNLLQCEGTSTQKGQWMEAADPSQALWTWPLDHRACAPVTQRQADTMQRQAPCSTSLKSKIKSFAPTSKCKMCFEAHGSGERPREMSSQGSELGSGPTEHLRSRAQPAGQPGGHRSGGQGPEASCVPGSRKPHLSAWETDSRRRVQISSGSARVFWKTR